MEQAVLPIDRDTMPFVAIPVGGPQDFLMLSERDECPFSFKVWGYFDLRGHLPDCEQATAEKAQEGMGREDVSDQSLPF